MKKLFFCSVLALAVLAPVFAFASTDLYGLSMMETANVVQKGHLDVSVGDDFWIFKGSNGSGSTYLDYVTGKITYGIVENLEASISYNQSIVISGGSDIDSSTEKGVPVIDIKYLFNIFNFLKISTGLGFGTPLDNSNYFIIYTIDPYTQVIPSVCADVTLGDFSVDAQVKLSVGHSSQDNEIHSRLYSRAALVYDAKTVKLAVSGALDQLYYTEPGQVMLASFGPEIVWPVTDMLQVNLSEMNAFISAFTNEQKYYPRIMLNLNFAL
jgi:hypothetical protein